MTTFFSSRKLNMWLLVGVLRLNPAWENLGLGVCPFCGDLGGEDPLEKEMATRSSILAWEILMNRGAWGATIHGVAKSQI